MYKYHKEPSLNFFRFFSLLSQVFLRDSQHALLQSRLHLEQIHKICVLQRWVKGALQRKQFIRQKNAAVVIQVRTENGGLPLSTMVFGHLVRNARRVKTPLLPSPTLKKNEGKAQPLDTSEGTFPYWGTVSRNILEEFFKNFYGNCKTSLKQS